MATLVPSLVRLRTDFDYLFPLRDKGSDGWIGDPAHAARDSDHNPDSRGLVHAIDVDKDLGPGVEMEDVVEYVVAGCREGVEKRLTYVIYNQRIWSAANAWKPRAYTGPNPHDKHAHFSASSVRARENDTTSWHLEEIPVALTADDKAWLKKTIESAVDARVGDVVPRWTDEGGRVPANDPNPKMTSAEGIFYAGATAKRIENLLSEVSDKLKS